MLGIFSKVHVLYDDIACYIVRVTIFVCVRYLQPCTDVASVMTSDVIGTVSF